MHDIDYMRFANDSDSLYQADQTAIDSFDFSLSGLAGKIGLKTRQFLNLNMTNPEDTELGQQIYEQYKQSEEYNYLKHKYGTGDW